MVKLCTILCYSQDAQSLFLLQKIYFPPPLGETLLLQCELKYLPLAPVVSILSGNRMGEVPFVMRLEQSAWIFELLLFLLAQAGLETAGLEQVKNCTPTVSRQKKERHKMLILIISPSNTHLCFSLLVNYFLYNHSIQIKKQFMKFEYCAHKPAGSNSCDYTGKSNARSLSILEDPYKI